MASLILSNGKKVELHPEGYSLSEIGKILGMSKMKVYA